jgi:hypothetical protein
MSYYLASLRAAPEQPIAAQLLACLKGCMRFGPTVDRSFARMIAIKRLVTGSAAIALGVAFVVALAARGGSPPPAALFALAIFFGGGAWTLRDGVRLRRELTRDR